MLAGLWGAHNYMNMAMAKKVKLDRRYKPDCSIKVDFSWQCFLQWVSWKKVKSALVEVQPNLFKFYDQRILQFKVFPLVWSSLSSFQNWKAMCAFFLHQLHEKKFRWETLLQSTTATIAESSGSLATVGPGPPSDRDSGLQLLLISLELHQVCGLRPDQELCCAGSQEKEVPSEMPTRGAQGLGILLNIFNQS